MCIRDRGYGPGGVAVIVEVLTDNRNRAAANVRATFGKNGGNVKTSDGVAKDHPEDVRMTGRLSAKRSLTIVVRYDGNLGRHRIRTKLDQATGPAVIAFSTGGIGLWSCREALE